MPDSDYFVIQTGGLTKYFRDFWGHKRVVAVNALNLEIIGHEVFGLLGPNGSGKSTTIKMLLGLLFPSRGWARVLGEPPGDVKTNARIGYLPEESNLYPFLNARETLDFYGRLFGLARAERRRRSESLLDMVGLSGATRRPVGEFSKGMARRLGLAQALINDPDLLILDEPTSGLDPIGTRQIKDLIRQLGQRGKTVLLCSHLLADVEDVCDRIAILYGGEMQTLGSVDSLLAHQDMTEIRTRRLSDAAVARIRGIIQEEDGQAEMDVRTPRDRLEDFFLRTVTKAQQQQKQTSGALVGAGISDFLTGTPAAQRPANVIEQLVAGREPAPHPLTTEPALTTSVSPAEVPPQREVLDALIKPKTTPVPPVRSTTPASTQAASRANPSEDGSDQAVAPVDRSVIDDLLKGRGGDA